MTVRGGREGREGETAPGRTAHEGHDVPVDLAPGASGEGTEEETRSAYLRRSASPGSRGACVPATRAAAASGALYGGGLWGRWSEESEGAMMDW